ncbi:DNA polymerase kappa isoform X1 [Python bivittatus]|uniref:DNA polymerase kappa n=1 Tax=Python bivittatus TaxID=176946 RepID=A0A9F5IR57_PYTBI|nr:DNA polymerase kappa isoform X1 [Python bivittatus]XP_007439923.1 DNA polymerase kappa isoform X1 [Python bivittatus]XP_025029959.1 DNA polymerase kappa isoform X1 [Python bivittatus]XP_025029960.1 DNA polymerase kappa isoform X1 [Python bivittatus]XP_025029961.1 DNA polymerase kappa isoform X1 [Python bivittatus]XP_025029962.1 DNA polymerase kappa isoform X1 [Python bivittatus]XP_025029963.1 DNA polymerase kappa isoform X1 [Python bivittatus]XP_025029964.1 DNA polymerase kappa isoform X1
MENAKKDNASSREGLLLRMGLNDNKAGMQGLDKEKINKIIMEASKGSKFYENELKKDQQVNKRIEKMLKLKSKITEPWILKAQLQMDKLAMELDQNRDLSCTIVHIDMDAFYAAVEMRDNPELRDRPIAVGSWNMLSTSNYHARRYGVRAAMPGFIAKKLCPHLTIVPLNFKKYEEVSKEIREILAEYDPQFMPMGLDEAYLNITEYLEKRKHCSEGKIKHFSTYKFGLNGKQNTVTSDVSNLSEDMHSCSPVLFDNDTLINKQTVQTSLPLEEQQCQQSRVQLKSVVLETSAEEVVEEIRFRIEQKTGLTASAGIAPNMMLAKMCSDKNKPNGQYRIPPEREAVMDFMKNLAIRKVPGIGKVTEKMLKALEIVTCTELYKQRALISLLFSETSCHNFLEISLGLGSTCLERDGERKSMSTERTFNEISASEQYTLCQELCSDLAQDLKKEGLKARTVTLKLKNVNFEVKTRANTVLSAVSTEEEIFAIAKDLLKAEMERVAPEPLHLRLMGVRISSFLTEEEKKYQQKSIVNFLEPGKQAGAFKKTVNIFPKVSEGESFFNKKRATRQQTNKGIFLNESSDKQNLQDLMSTITSGEQGKNYEHQIFICPICFEEQHDGTLEAFNRHIDMCLSGTIEKENAEITDTGKSGENDLHVDREKEERIKVKISKPSVEEQSTNTADCVPASSTDVLPKLLVYKQNENGCGPSNASIPEMHARDDLSSKALLIEKESSCPGSNVQSFSDITENVLVCPVCNIQQKTMDLALFNRHVDVCLNKGIIKQLTENSSTEILDRGQYNTNSSVGTKRSGTVISHSTSKKAKSSNSRCTIESFFK